MSHFLWVEDFENNPQATTHDVFGSILPNTYAIPDSRHQLKKTLRDYGIQVALSFQDGRQFIENPARMRDIDYIVLDIDLPACSEGDTEDQKTLDYLRDWHGYEPDEQDDSNDELSLKKAGFSLKKIAGYHLYIKLVMEFGFPREHILICSNHGENLLSIQKAFHGAKMVAPIIYTKSDSSIRNKILECNNTPYTVLRRGIIASCQWVLDWLHDDDQIAINRFIEDHNRHYCQDDIRLIFESLQEILPRREPEPEIKYALFRQFIRALSHAWEITPWPKEKPERPAAMLLNARILKTCRNWSAHGKIFNQALPETLLAYLMLMNLRAMLAPETSIMPHERVLLCVFAVTPGGKETRLNSKHEEKLRKTLASLIKKYNYSKNVTQQIPTAITFDNGYQKKHEFDRLLNECLNDPIFIETYAEELLRGLFLLYWTLSNSKAEQDEFHTELDRALNQWYFPYSTSTDISV
ncbi:hypothetical protein [Chromatium okenii]|uniref:hypothetical protein n=1 Tax=Chromatium okenii TaxID=61644 RepID=UPI0026EC4AF6|nr:hypothetical protein [Chromatium okenii]MBV5308769.1 hypothetical protein [Chromatium okenii]